MNERSGRANNKRFRGAAIVFALLAAASTTIFVLTKDKSPDASLENDISAESAVSEESETVTSETTAPVTETAPAHIVTASPDDIISGTLPPSEETEADEENADGGEVYDESGGTEAPQQTRTVITSRDRREYTGRAVYIDMKNILQNPELPVGCEITALTILLNYWGFDADKVDMAKNYLPVSSGRYKYEDGKTYKDSFYDYFIGDPFSRGYGCFSNAIVKAANKYISSNGGGYSVVNISGCGPDTLYDYVSRDVPVLVWATDGMIEPEYYETWYDIDTGEQLDWYLNEHCMVLSGFDIDAGVVTVNDPMKGIIDYNIDRFETRFSQMHSQAVVILPDASEPEETEAEAAETAAPETEATTAETTAAETEAETQTEVPVEEEYTDTLEEWGDDAAVYDGDEE